MWSGNESEDSKDSIELDDISISSGELLYHVIRSANSSDDNISDEEVNPAKKRKLQALSALTPTKISDILWKDTSGCKLAAKKLLQGKRTTVPSSLISTPLTTSSSDTSLLTPSPSTSAQSSLESPTLAVRKKPRKRLAMTPIHSSVPGSDTLITTTTITTTDVPTTPTPTTSDEYIVNFRVRSGLLHGQNNHKWSTTPSSRLSMRIPNIVAYNKGPLLPHGSQFVNPQDFFLLFLNDQIISEIVTWTNQCINIFREKYRDQNSPTTSNTCAEEIKALLGLLVMMGVQNDGHVATEELFSKKFGRGLYRAAIGEKRFTFLLRALHFDDKTTRDEHKRTDKLPPIRYVWDKFIENCQSYYVPGDNITIDEQLLAFRGRCSFRMYIPSKPAKYGIKLIMICDSETNYMTNALPYLGKFTGPSKRLPLAHYVTTELCKPYKNTGRHLTGNNWFTSIALVKDLLENFSISYTGTIRKNKVEIPPHMKDVHLFKPGQTAFVFDSYMTLLSHFPPKNKSKKKLVHLLSSKHHAPDIAASGKPKIILSYNKTKGGVDTFDEICANNTCSRMTKR